MFKAKKACADCPFLKKTLKGWLGKETTSEIVQNLRGDKIFPCHKHVNYNDASFERDGGASYALTRKDQFCAGALLLMKKEGILLDNFNTRLGIMGLLGESDRLDPEKLTSENTVFDNFDQFIDHHSY